MDTIDEMEFPKSFGSVSYKRETQERFHRYRVTIHGVTHRLKLERLNDDIVALQYIGDEDEPVPFPAGFTVLDTDRQPAAYMGSQYALVWVNSYEVRYNGHPVLVLRNQRQQSVHGSTQVESGFTGNVAQNTVDRYYSAKAAPDVVVELSDDD